MKKIFLALVVVGVLGVSGVASKSFAMGYFDQSKKIEELEKKYLLISEANTRTLERVFELEENVKKNEKNESFSRKYLFDLTWRLASLFPSDANIPVGEKKYSLVSCPGSLMSVSFSSIKKQAAGSDLIIEFVNFYSVTATDVDVTITYSKENLDYDEKLTDIEMQAKITEHQKYKKTKKEKIISILPGSMAYLNIFIPEYKPDEIKYLSISINSQGMRYKKPPNN